jgi:hypothetical protein
MDDHLLALQYFLKETHNTKERAPFLNINDINDNSSMIHLFNMGAYIAGNLEYRLDLKN